MRCLVVDDDIELQASVMAYLGRFQIQCTAASDGREMRIACTNDAFDVVLLDLMLPDEDGLSLCQWLRQTSGTVGIIMLTGQGDPTSRVVGLEFGADDYIAKPFDPRELVARVKAVARRLSASSQPPPAHAQARSVRRFGGWVFDTVKRELKSPRQVLVPLSSAEYRLLMAFLDHPRRILTRDQLIDLTRGPAVDVSDRSIDLAVSRLRQKLGDPKSGGQLITTIRGEGYTFDPDVT